MNVEVRPFSLSLARPLETASGPIERRDGFLVVVEADDVAGTGEATPLPGWTEPAETCEAELEAGVRRLRREGLDVALDDREDVLPDHDGAPAARHGLDLALADIAARRTGTPLFRHLGGPTDVDSVPVNAVVGAGSLEETVAAAVAAVDAGFICLKLKAGARAVDEDVERVAAVRDAIGPDPTLRVDANGAWSRESAARAMTGLRTSEVTYVEQPLPPDDLEGCAALRGGPVGVAVDETLVRHDPGAVLDAGAADALIVKPMVLGGPTRSRSVATRARERGVDAVVTTTVDGVVARTGAVHLAASLPDPAPSGLATGEWLADDLAPDPVTVSDGRASVPRTPGHGVAVGGDPP